jgi:hypothetical protein
MNGTDRKTLAKILQDLGSAKTALDSLAEDEREKFDNMSEGLQQAENGQKLSEAADALESARDSLDEAISSLEGIE